MSILNQAQILITNNGSLTNSINFFAIGSSFLKEKDFQLFNNTEKLIAYIFRCHFRCNV